MFHSQIDHIDGSFNEPCVSLAVEEPCHPDLPRAHFVEANMSASGIINLSVSLYPESVDLHGEKPYDLLGEGKDHQAHTRSTTNDYGSVLN